MQPSFFIRASSISIFLLVACPVIAGTAQYRSREDIDLPPLQQRSIIGTWLATSPLGTCTRSLEKAGGKVYDVLRCSDGSGGKTGRVLKPLSSKKFLLPTSTTGDHYVILSNGDLSVRDKDGEIEVNPKHPTLWPSKANIAAAPSRSKDPKTLGLNCYDVGYRYGFAGTSAMKGKPVNPSWDFATPERCKTEPATQRGILAGTRSAS